MKYLLQQKSETHFRPFVQSTLEIGKVDDPQEKEADAVEDKVMRMTDGTEGNQRLMKDGGADKIRLMSDGTEQLQMKCAACEEAVQKKDADEEEDKLQMKCAGCEEKEKVQKKENGKMYASSDITEQLQSNKGSGESLPEQTQQDLGNKIGADFSNVNIHTDANAVQMSKELGAKAFTHGNDIYFNAGQYNPSSSQGKHLLVHELTHTVQQSGKINRQNGGPDHMDPYQMKPSLLDDELLEPIDDGTEIDLQPMDHWTAFTDMDDEFQDEKLLRASKEEITAKMNDILQTIIAREMPKDKAATDITADQLLEWREKVVETYNQIAGMKDNEIYDFRTHYGVDKARARQEKFGARQEFREAKRQARWKKQVAMSTVKIDSDTQLEKDLNRLRYEIESDSNIPEEKRDEEFSKRSKAVEDLSKQALHMTKKGIRSTQRDARSKARDTKKIQVQEGRRKLKDLRGIPKSQRDYSRIGVTDRTEYDKEISRKAKLRYSDTEYDRGMKVIDPMQFDLQDEKKFSLEPITIRDVIPLIVPRADDSLIDSGTGPYSKFNDIESEINHIKNSIVGDDSGLAVLEARKKEIKDSLETENPKGTETDIENLDQSIAVTEKSKKEKEDKLEETKKAYGEKMELFEQIKNGEKEPDLSAGDPSRKDLQSAEETWKEEQEKLGREELKQKYMKLYGFSEDDKLLHEMVNISLKMMNPQKWKNYVTEDEPGYEKSKTAGMIKEEFKDKSKIEGGSMTISSAIKYGVYNTVDEKRHSAYQEESEYEEKPGGKVNEEFTWVVNYRVKVKK
jgi:hypothetical protein